MKSYREFWPFYLSQHRNVTCRRLHFTGTTLALACVAGAFIWTPLAFGAPVVGYGLAWIGHVVYEKNRPATFKHPLWSLRADFEMYLRILTRRKLG